MARPKEQSGRRLTLVSAAEKVVARDGLAGVTLKDVAFEARMSANAALYYYPSLKDLLDDVQGQAVERFCVMRAAVIADIASPPARLRAMLDSGLPTGPDDTLCRLLYELGSYARTDARYAAQHIILFERQVALYQGILEAGKATGHFKLNAGSDAIARGLVVLEDGLGLHLLNMVPAVDRKTALGIIKQYAGQATGYKTE